MKLNHLKVSLIQNFPSNTKIIIFYFSNNSFKNLFRSLSQTFKDFSRDYQFGIFQSIGFKEFERYFQSKTEAEFENGVNEMKSSTRRYAKYQAKWINNRFIKSIHLNCLINTIVLYC